MTWLHLSKMDHLQSGRKINKSGAKKGNLNILFWSFQKKTMLQIKNTTQNLHKLITEMKYSIYKKLQKLKHLYIYLGSTKWACLFSIKPYSNTWFTKHMLTIKQHRVTVFIMTNWTLRSCNV